MTTLNSLGGDSPLPISTLRRKIFPNNFRFKRQRLENKWTRGQAGNSVCPFGYPSPWAKNRSIITSHYLSIKRQKKTKSFIKSYFKICAVLKHSFPLNSKQPQNYDFQYENLNGRQVLYNRLTPEFSQPIYTNFVGEEKSAFLND